LYEAKGFSHNDNEKRVEASRKQIAGIVHFKVDCKSFGNIKIIGFVKEMHRNEIFKLAQECIGVESMDNDLDTIRLHKP